MCTVITTSIEFAAYSRFAVYEQVLRLDVAVADAD